LFIKVSVARRSRLVYVLLQGKVPIFARVGKSLARCLFLKRSEDLVEKIVSPVLFDTLKWQNTLSLKKELFIKVS